MADRVKRSLKNVRTALHEEKEAIKDYRKQAKKAEPRTAKVFRHIAKEEVHHKQELSKVKKRLMKR